MNRLFQLILAAALASCSLAGQLPPPKPSPLIGARSLALSPDGSRLAFSYQGDIWVVSSAGGRAVPVTNHIEMDDNPIWSPDGMWIAFASNRSGNNDIYVVPADGGETKRLTFHSGSDVPSDWSPDGKQILFRAVRDDPNNALFTVDVNTTRTRRLMLDFMTIGSPKYSPDGKRVLYTRLGFPWVRARYQGSAASQIWEFDPAVGKRTEVRNTGFQNLWPDFAGDGSVLTVTVADKTPSSSYIGKPIPRIVDSVDRTPNVYQIDKGGKAHRLTDFVSTGTRFLSVAKRGSNYAFEDDGDVYVAPIGGKPKKIAITASIDDKTTQEERLILTNGATDLALSPKGDKIAFTAHGDIWTVSTKKGKGPNADDATQLTDWAGFDEQPLWGPDGKTLFFASDRDGAMRLFKMDTSTKAVTPVSLLDDDVAMARLTPDKKSVTYWQAGKQGGLYTVPIAGGAPKLLISKPGSLRGDGSLAYDWSPDRRFIAYSEVLQRSGYYYWENTTDIHIFEVASGKSHNVTRLSAQHIEPQWSPDGRYLYFVSNRAGQGLYVLPLKAEDARETELELKYEKPEDGVTVDIDFDGIENRVRRIGTAPSAGGPAAPGRRRTPPPVAPPTAPPAGPPAALTPSGNLRFDETNGDVYFLQDGDIWKATYEGDDPRKLTQTGGIASFEMSDDGNSIAFLGTGGVLNTLEIHRPQAAVATVAFRADWIHDLRKEHQAAFDEFWRSYNNNFYDPNFHGRDWAMLKRRYEKFLPSVGHRNEMATILNEMVGEMECSHSEVSPAAGNPAGQTSAHPGFLIDYGYEGPGLKVLAVPPNTPGSFKRTHLSPGEVVLTINGRAVTADEELYHDVLNEQAGRDITLHVKGLDGKERDVRYRALTSPAFGNILTENRLQARRKYVEEKSGGKLTYAHISGMNPAALGVFNQQVWEFAADKKGLIIDVRNNGGGNTSDQIIDVLERQPNTYYVPRDEDPMLGPGQALAFPMVVMAAETSFSNAEMFSYAMKARHLATLVGMPTPGYVIYTGGLRLVDGTGARMPGTGVFRLDGSPLEDMGQQMDYKVDITPEDYFPGRDPQLDKAIEVLMKQVK